MIRLQEVYMASNGVLLVRNKEGQLVSFLWSDAVMRGLEQAGLSDAHIRQAETAALAEYTSSKQPKNG